MDIEALIGGTFNAWLAVILPSQRIFYMYLLSAFVIAGASWVYFSHREENARPDGIKKGLLGYIFDPNVWLHRSAKQDYVYFLLNALLYYGIIAQLLISGHLLFNTFDTMFVSLFGAPDGPIFEPSIGTAIAYTIAVVLAIDLAVWLTHYLQHKVIVLWQFHQVHHSAEVLTPVTVYRMHPVDLFFTGFVGIVLMAVAFSGFTYLTQSKPTEVMVMNLNLITFTFYLVGYNLRHSHIWLSYPVWLSHIFISPAMHQIHHSIEKKHWDKNMGLVFSVWDWAFGTLYVPRAYEKLEFGVSREEPNPFGSVVDIYLKPFRLAWAEIARANPNWVRRSAVICLIVAGSIGYLSLKDASIAADRALPSVHLEDLTWTEVEHALADGFDTVIIPTGGTEQNGPHVILGKHNYIVRTTSEMIAEGLGDTLVAPVLSYVPEGDTGAEPTGHMRYPGTLSIPEDVFGQVLEHAARSMATHGFTRILFVGDSGGNQATQERIANQLNDEWTGTGVQVIHVSDYYFANGQHDTLVSQGYSDGHIGTHAGIRDTSEVLAVNPAGVRANPILPKTDIDSGYNGAPAKATEEIGQLMLTLKVDAALRQIRQLSRPAS